MIDLRSPFPWFGGKSRVSDLVWDHFGDVANYVEWIGHMQFAGCLPTRLPVVLTVLHRFALRARTSAAVHLSWNSGRCSSKWPALLLSSKLSGASLSLFLSLWWTLDPLGIGPCADSQTYSARKIHLFGSAIFTYALRSPLRLWRVLIVTVPTGTERPSNPSTNRPSKFLMLYSIHGNYAHVN